MAETLETQETVYFSDPLEDDIDISLLRLNSFGNTDRQRRHRATSSPPQFQSYGSFGSSSSSPVKRPSPESQDDELPQRKKKLFGEDMSNMMGYSKVPLPVLDPNPNRIGSKVYQRSLSDTVVGAYTFGSGNGIQESAPSASLPPRPPIFRRSVSDVSPSPSKTRLNAIPEADKMLYVIKDGVRELDQWCNKLLKYGESVKQNDSITPQVTVQEEEEVREEEEEQKECKEGVKVDRVGEAFVVEINCPCGRNYRTLFSGRDCYYKLL